MNPFIRKPYVASHLSSLRSAFVLTTQLKLPSGRPLGTPKSMAPSLLQLPKWSTLKMIHRLPLVHGAGQARFSVFSGSQLHLHPSSLFSLLAAHRERLWSVGCQFPTWSPADTVWMTPTSFLSSLSPQGWPHISTWQPLMPNWPFRIWNALSTKQAGMAPAPAKAPAPLPGKASLHLLSPASSNHSL